MFTAQLTSYSCFSQAAKAPWNQQLTSTTFWGQLQDDGEPLGSSGLLASLCFTSYTFQIPLLEVDLKYLPFVYCLSCFLPEVFSHVHLHFLLLHNGPAWDGKTTCRPSAASVHATSSSPYGQTANVWNIHINIDPPYRISLTKTLCVCKLLWENARFFNFFLACFFLPKIKVELRAFRLHQSFVLRCSKGALPQVPLTWALGGVSISS